LKLPPEERTRDLGLLVLRVGVGAAFMAHGWPKLAGGAAKWEDIGGAMAHLGLDFAPTMWGFLAACNEFFGGLMLALGLGFRLACLMLLSTMMVATTMHLRQGDSFGKTSHALESAVLFASLFLIGAGKWAADRKITRR
jgi:putative oxidoreductase